MSTFKVGEKVLTKRHTLNYKGENANKEKLYVITKIMSDDKYKLDYDFRTSYSKDELIKVDNDVVKIIVERNVRKIQGSLDKIKEVTSLL